MKFFKKSQSAVEFLMTYGWAFIAVIVGIGTLSYFGFLNPSNLLPEKCVLQSDVSCIGYKVEPSRITLIMLHSMDNSILIKRIDFGQSCGSSFSETMLSGKEYTFVPENCNNGLRGDKFKSDIIISYIEKNSNLSRNIYGNINSKIE